MIDYAIIAAHGPHDILGQCTTVQWPDGSTLALHWVAVGGSVRTALRAHCHDGLHWVVVDVTRLGCEALTDLVRTLSRLEGDGIVDYHLRRAFPSAEAFAAQALALREAAWTVTQREAA